MNKFNIFSFTIVRKHAEAQTEHAMRNGGMRNFDNPLYGPNSGAQTQTDENGVAVGTQASHYDVPKSKKGKGNSKRGRRGSMWFRNVMGRQIAWYASVTNCCVLCACAEKFLSFCHDFHRS